MPDSSPATLIIRIQEQLHASAARNMEPVAVSPFTCFFNSDSDAPWSNYAIPAQPVRGDVAGALEPLCAEFRARSRVPRFEFIAEYTPELAQILSDAGFAEESKTQLMLCTPASWVQAVDVPGLHISIIADDDPLARVQALMNVQSRSFGDDSATPVGDEEAIQFHKRFRELDLFIADLEGQSVSGGSLMQPYQGISEIAGIATLTSFRRRGIASAVTAQMAQVAFAKGLDAVFLTAADANAGRVYERVGFQPVGTGLSYIWPTEAN